MDKETISKLKWKAREAVPIVILVALDLMMGGRGTTHLIRAVVHQKIKEWDRKQKQITNSKRIEEEQEKAREKNFLNTLSRLRRDGLILNSQKGIWKLTQLGKEFIKKIQAPKISPFATEEDKKNADVVLIFDVPEKFRVKRNTLREKLINSDFKYLQRSVWIGKGVLLLEFLKFLKDQKLISFVHIFTIDKKGTII